MKRLVIILGLVCLLALPLACGCGGPKIRVGSYPDPEGTLLAQLIILALEEGGFQAVDAGAYEDAPGALAAGKIDIFPEYYAPYLDGEAAAMNAALLKPALARSQWSIVIPESLSRAENITDMTGFAAYLARGGRVKLICSPDFVSAEYALTSFERTYGFKLTPEQLVVVPSYNYVYMWTQVADPDNDINAGIAYTTSGRPETYHLVMLEDDKKAQPDFNPVPVVRRAVYDRNAARLNRALAPLFASLTDAALRELNSETGLSGKQATCEVARRYLVQNGFFRYSELEMVQRALDDMMLANRLTSVTAHTGATSDMSDFPDQAHPLYSEAVKWPYLAWRITDGSYTCDAEGRVTQVTTGWD